MYMGMVDPAKKPQRAMQISMNGRFVVIVAKNRATPARAVPNMDKVKGFPPAFIIGPISRREAAVPTQKRESDIAVIDGD